jgi:fermentation-respiration switch protein FrsA (DUF1100 family)
MAEQIKVTPGQVWADILRPAAALMRERAEATMEEDTGLDENSWYRIEDAEPTAIRTKWWAFAQANEADADHIASWHPTVALAVADWLDAQARGSITPSWHALMVARAYLGEEA